MSFAFLKYSQQNIRLQIIFMYKQDLALNKCWYAIKFNQS